ncbi:uncharacterized protein [Takifugu rubripes]|uniref:uncharacterized protein n=1 Tax=Takifugu rubripes TaxID=31033 RepID=UPI0005D27677|nr:uncharacterized protein LOC105416511 [Takifugu rubripes]|eukprot:XP_011602671.1 PREDICTED: uncharacterized protein LOC105416511 [Takifugu rubripes]
MADARAVLQGCDPALLDPHADLEQPGSCEEAGMLLYLMDSRRVQKVLWRQLFVLDSMMSLVEGLESAQHLSACPPQPVADGGARSRWKALKAESRSGGEQAEALLQSLQDRILQIDSRRHRVSQLIQDLSHQKQQSAQMRESFCKAQNALQSCDHQLAQLRAQSEAALRQVTDQQRVQDRLQVQLSVLQELMQIHLLSIDQSELCMELRPRPPCADRTSELDPLRLSVTWSHDDHFTLQVSDVTAGLVEDCVSGRRTELSTALLEVMQRYLSQFQLLSEIQGLRSSFAIDWRPAQRLLLYLKSAALVCHLEVEEGYPSTGRARLVSVQRNGQAVNTSGLKPPHSGPSLTDWLVFLCSCPLL